MAFVYCLCFCATPFSKRTKEKQFPLAAKPTRLIVLLRKLLPLPFSSSLLHYLRHCIVTELLQFYLSCWENSVTAPRWRRLMDWVMGWMRAKLRLVCGASAEEIERSRGNGGHKQQTFLLPYMDTHDRSSLPIPSPYILQFFIDLGNSSIFLEIT